MYLFHVLRSFLPMHNPIGFGGSDFIFFALTLLLVLLVLARAWLAPAAQALARRTGWSMLLLAVLVAALRLALLPVHPVPTAAGADDFSFLLLGDTLAHFRLANPVHPLHRFFETTFVLQQPSYSSIYPLAQGFVLAFGQLLFGHPWAGILVSMALLCALCYWMLLGWVSPGWALAGGLLAVCQFGPLNAWMNNYWGGAPSAIAGCLVFGALPRLRRGFKPRDALWLGLGLGIQMNSRPFESIFLDVSVILFFLPELRRPKQWPQLVRAAVFACAAVAPAAGLMLLHNHASTGSWTTLPYALSRYQYGVPTTFTFQPNPVPHNILTPAQELYAEGQAAVHGPADTAKSYFFRLGSRAGFYRFFFLPPLLLALPFFLLRLRRVSGFSRAASCELAGASAPAAAPGAKAQSSRAFSGRLKPCPDTGPILLCRYRYAWMAITVALFALGTNFYPYFFTQYVAALTSLFLLAAVLGLERLSEVAPAGEFAARFLVALCAAHFLFWYGLHTTGDERIFRAMAPYETADAINYGDADGRIAINRRLALEPGRQLVFVRYFSTHGYHEWIHNAADIDRARVVWALDLGPAQNDDLKRYFPDRKVWLMEPDALPPRLAAYPASHGMFENIQ